MASSLVVVDNEMCSLTELQKYISNGIKITTSVANDFLQMNQKDSSNEELKQLEECMLELITLEREMKQFQDAAKHIRKKLTEKDENSENVLIDEVLDAAINELAESNTDASLQQHPSYKKFRTMISTSMEQSEEALSEEQDLVIAKQTFGTIDPLTQQEIKDPVRNSHCGHIYDRTSIMQYLGSKPRDKKKCPYFGCKSSRPLNKKDLIECQM